MSPDVPGRNEGARFDAIVVGAGHNGLVAGATLAARGRSVCVVERAHEVGGMARDATLADGSTGPWLAHLIYNLNPAVTAALGLEGALETVALPSVLLAEDGRHVVVTGDEARFADGGAHPDAAAFAALRARLRAFAAMLDRVATRTPPAPSFAGSEAIGDMGALGKLGLELRRSGRASMREFLRIVLSNAHDVILDELPDGPLAGMLAADAVRGAFAGPRAPGTVFTLLYRLGQGGGASLPVGGMGALAAALRDAAARKGCEIRTGQGAARVLVEDDRVCGVTLEDGAELRARAVLSSVGALESMRLAGPVHYDAEAVRRLRNLRAKSTTAKVNLTLTGPPDAPGLSRDEFAGRLILAPSAAYVERAFNPVKYGRMSAAPVIEAVIPTLHDPEPGGKDEGEGSHVMSAIVQHVPGDADPQAVARLAIDALAAHLPGLPDLVATAQCLTPAGIAAATGAPGGHWHHGELAIDQLLTVRPVNGMARYTFGVPGYYLCGAGAHPGGDVTGLPGRNAALQALRDGAL